MDQEQDRDYPALIAAIEEAFMDDPRGGTVVVGIIYRTMARLIEDNGLPRDGCY
jgi:hypothetical protein